MDEQKTANEVVQESLRNLIAELEEQERKLKEESERVKQELAIRRQALSLLEQVLPLNPTPVSATPASPPRIPPTARRTRSTPRAAIASIQRIIDESVSIVRNSSNVDGVHYSKIYDALQQKGIGVPGLRPLLNLSTILSRVETLERVARGTYRLRRVPKDPKSQKGD